MRLFIYGFGFAGAATARLMLSKGWSVAGAARSAVTEPGVEPVPAEDRKAVRAAAQAGGSAWLSRGGRGWSDKP